MQILKDGDMSRISWWYVLKPWECDHCGCVFRVEEEDYPKIDIVNNHRCAILRCPYCRGRVERYEEAPATREGRRLGGLGNENSPGHRKGG